VVLVAPTFHSDAISIELRRREQGWDVCFVGTQERESEFFSRAAVRDDIGDRAVKNEGNVVRYVESCLRAAGYRSIARRPTGAKMEVAAVWDLVTPTAA
jgi:hypothetical protein